jgi:hypothetical protein
MGYRLTLQATLLVSQVPVVAPLASVSRRRTDRLPAPRLFPTLPATE